jgi:hypothetical protein
LAAAHGKVECVRLLLKMSTNSWKEWWIERKDGKSGDTALHRACAEGQEEVVRLLLDEKANPLVTNQLGRTPMHLAVKAGDAAIVRYLLRAGASQMSLDLDGRRPIAAGAGPWVAPAPEALKVSFSRRELIAYTKKFKPHIRILPPPDSAGRFRLNGGVHTSKHQTSVPCSVTMPPWSKWPWQIWARAMLAHGRGTLQKLVRITPTRVAKLRGVYPQAGDLLRQTTSAWIGKARRESSDWLYECMKRSVMASSGGFALRGRMPKLSRCLRRVHNMMMLIATESCLSIFFSVQVRI